MSFYLNFDPLFKDFWREVNVTKEKVYYRGYTLPDDICKMKQATRRTGLAPRTVLPQLFRMFNSLFSIFKILNTGFRTFFDILKIGKDILNLIGIRKRDDVVLFDKVSNYIISSKLFPFPLIGFEYSDVQELQALDDLFQYFQTTPLG